MDVPSDQNLPTYYETLLTDKELDQATFLPLSSSNPFAVTFEKRDQTMNRQIRSRVSKEKHSLVLYIRPQCPYCKKVMNCLASLNKTIPIQNINEPKALQEYRNVGYKMTVPCLLIDGVPLYESKDIIKWLKAHQNTY